MDKKSIVITAVVSVAVLLLGTGTLIRNRVYSTELRLWEDCARKNEFKDMRSLVTFSAALAREGRFTESWGYLEKALSLDWKDRRFTLENLRYLTSQYSLYFHGEASHQLGQFMFELDPRVANGLELISVNYFAEGDMENARIGASLLARLFDYPTAYAILGDVYQYQGCYKQADACYARCIKAEPNNPRWHLNNLKNSLGFKTNEEILKMLTRIQGLFPPAFSELVRTVVTSSDIPDSPFLLDYALFYNKRFKPKEALAATDAYVKRYGGISRIPGDDLTRVSGMYSDLKQYDKALEILDEGLKRNPQAVNLTMLKAGVLYKNGAFSESALLYHSVVQRLGTRDEALADRISRKRDLAQRKADAEKTL